MSSVFFSAVSVAAVVIAVAGLVTLGLGIRRLAAAARTKNWPQVPGTILTSTVEEKVTTEQDDGAPPREVHLFKAAVTYRYQAAGKEFEGSRIAPDEFETSHRHTAAELAGRYPVGGSVQVFHEPTAPANALLQPGISGASAILPSVGVGLLFLGAAMFGHRLESIGTLIATGSPDRPMMPTVSLLPNTRSTS